MPAFHRSALRQHSSAHERLSDCDAWSENETPWHAQWNLTQVALKLGLGLAVYAVDPKVDGPWPWAGPRRNERMLFAERERIHVVMAFTSRRTGELTSGTADCVAKAERMGLTVVRVSP